MFVLQHYSQGVWSFLPFNTIAELFQHARANYGLSEMQFLEYAIRGNWGTDSDPFTLQWWEGEVPQMLTMKGSKDMGAALRSTLTKK